MLLDHLTRNIRGLIHRRRATETPPLFFMHIPKNAGTSLIYLLANRFPAAACLLFADWPASQTQDVNQFRFVSGHIGYQYLERFRLRPNVVTFLRHPLDRAMSSFFFIKTAGPERIRKLREKATQEGDLCQLRLLDDVCRLDLRDFLREEPESSQKFFTNSQTRFLAGVPEGGKVSDLVSLACDNLTRCEVVGLTERFDDSVELLCHQMGWERFSEIRRRNVTPQRLKVTELDEATQAILAEQLASDLALYEFGRKLFQERMQAASNSQRLVQTRWRPSALPDATDYTLDRPIIGAGWHPREQTNDANWSCWTGPGTDAWLEFQPMRLRHGKFRCELFHHVDPQVLQAVQVRINDHLIAIEKRDENGRVVLEGSVPAAAMNANRERLRISFSVNNRWRPCDLDPTSNDDRWLGISVSRISLTDADLQS